MRPLSSSTKTFLFIVVGALAIAALVSLFQRRHSYFFEVTIVSARAETSKLYFDMGRGFSEADSSLPYRHRGGSTRYRFVIPRGTVHGLRFDPLDFGDALIRDPVIVDRNGTVVTQLDYSQFKPGNQIESIGREGEGLRVVSVPKAADPNLIIAIPSPIRLQKLGFDPWGKVREAFPAFVVALLTGLGVWLYPSKTTSSTDATRGFAPHTPLFTNVSFRAKFIVTTAVLVILFWRLPDRFLNPQFYAEDGYFFTEALKYGAKSFITPYGGYHLFVPRLGEWVATFLPLLWVPAFLNAVALLCTLSVVWKAMSDRVSLPHKPLLAFAVVFFPRTEDIFLTIENVQWTLALLLVLVLISREPVSQGQKLRDYAGILVCGFTGVFCVILLPLFGLRVLLRRTSHSLVLLVLVAIAAAIQVWFVRQQPPLYGELTSPIDPLIVPSIIGFQLFVRTFAGYWLPPLTAYPVLIAGLLVPAVVLYLASNRNRPREEQHSRWMLGLAFFLLLTASLYRFKSVLFIFMTPEQIARYFFPTTIVLIWLVVGELASDVKRRALSFAFLTAYFIAGISRFHANPLWNYDWRKSVAQIEAGENVVVPINPPGWYFQYIGKPKN